jgi:MFS family permease
MRRYARLTVDARPLRIPAYRRLWFAGIVTGIGGQLTVVAVPVQLFGLTGSSATVGLSGIVAFAALAGSALWGGALADVTDRRRLLFRADLGLAVVSALLWLQAALELRSVAVVLLLVAVQWVFLGTVLTTMGAALPRVVPAELIPAASSLALLVRRLGEVTGPLLAGTLIPVIGLPRLYLLDALALGATLWAVYRLPPLPPAAGAARRTDLRHLADGFRYLARQKVLLAVLAADLSATLFALPVALFPQVAQERFGGPGLALGLLYAAWPIGALAMALVSGTVTRATRYGAMVTGAVVAWGLTVIGFGLSASLGAAVGFLVAGGAAMFVLSTFRNAITLTAAADDMLGRTQGAVTVFLLGGPTLSVFLHGFAGAAIGPTWTVAGGGALAVVAMLAIVAAVPEFWRHRAPAPTAPRRAGGTATGAA